MMPWAVAVTSGVVTSLIAGSAVALLLVALGSLFDEARVRARFDLAAMVSMALAFCTGAFGAWTADAAPSFAGAGPAPIEPAPWLLPDFVAALYVTGAVLATLRCAPGLWALQRLRKSAHALPPSLEHRLEELARRVGAAARGGFAQSERTATALVVGWWRPMVLLPSSWVTRLDPEVIEAIALHELEHVRRADVLLGYLQAALGIVLWFHPLAWWIERRLSRHREYACDDAAAESVGAPAYARALVDAESMRSGVGVGAVAFGGEGLSVRARVLRLVKPRPRSFIRRFGVALAPAVLAVVGLTVHAISPPAPEASALEIPWLPEPVRAWEDEIIAAANTHDIDPELLAIVTLVESGGNPAATSSAGARGLVQVMPTTALDVAERRGLAPPNAIGLYDPALNLDYGAWYLAQQLRAFEGHDAPIELAAAAYNGGPGRVRAWLDGRRSLASETKAYKALVSQLYAERRDPSSPTFAKLRERRGG